eukprot:2062783-Pyramimonas_sp.AAC.1
MDYLWFGRSNMRGPSGSARGRQRSAQEGAGRPKYSRPLRLVGGLLRNVTCNSCEAADGAV